MYDLAWSERVYRAYTESCPRTEQIARCIQQLASNYEPRIRHPSETLKRAIIRSIRGEDKGWLWNRYKRLCRKTPLDTKLLATVAERVYFEGRDEALQLTFHF